MNTQVAVRENPSEKILEQSLLQAESILQKRYLSRLGCCPVVCDYIKRSDLGDVLNSKVRFFEVSRIVFNKNECVRDKLASVFNAVNNTGASFLFQIQGKSDSVSLCVGVKSPQNIVVAQRVLASSLKGNFPGTDISSPLTVSQLNEKVLDNFQDGKTVAVVTDIAGIRTQEESQHQFVQGLEKVIDAMRGREYTLFLIADPISLTDLDCHRRALEDLYTQLVPLSCCQLTFGESASLSLSETVSQGISQSINTSISDSVTHTVGKTSSVTHGTSSTDTTGTSKSNTMSVSSGHSFSFLGFGLSKTKGISTTTGINQSHSTGVSFSTTTGMNSSDSIGRTTSSGESSGWNSSQSVGSQNQQGQSLSMQIAQENHFITKMMERIDKMLERYDQCADLGMWNCAMYCIGDEHTVDTLASIYRSTIRGKDSSLENGAIVTWNRESSKRVLDYLRIMEHPRFKLDEGNELTPGTLVSSAELAIQAGLPNRSIPGIPVLECAEFGRNVSSYGSLSRVDIPQIYLGKIFHMHQEETLPVCLDSDSLASHTFITGSTGSGKSNTVYQLLRELRRSGKKFLVVESAKGEYKDVLGGWQDVNIYGTNPSLTPLLRINPFSFPHGNEDATKNIHILEHLDRLIEIFNVCWPMYAAMPAILKEAVEKSYEDCGWNLLESINPYEVAGQSDCRQELYPTFTDVARNICTIIESSEYDAENKGAYKGALITRLKSLSNGINGLIFTTDELSCKELFNKNVIVDLSRVGSTETKSLIMGLLVLKLHEYRMTEDQVNASLRHVTVLEEAHNLLKRTSTEQSTESSNLLGKSVEMLANSIAEMRTYGQGFVIADQAPGLLDLSVIRNTNTKIIMRLPDQGDRELVGRAANLNDDQITELARLPLGVAAVYQNEWIEPVLCKVEKFKGEQKFQYSREKVEVLAGSSLKERISMAKILCESENEAKFKEIEGRFQKTCSGMVYVSVKEYFNSQNQKPNYDKLSFIVSSLLPELTKSLKDSAMRNPSNVKIWRDDLQETIERILTECGIETQAKRTVRNSILQCILQNYILGELNKPQMISELLNNSIW